MTQEQVGGVVRTFLAFVAGYIVSKGWVDQETALQVTGAVGVILVAAWSWWQKHIAAKSLAVATLTPSDPVGVREAKAALTPQEITRVTMSPDKPPAAVSATGTLVDKPA